MRVILFIAVLFFPIEALACYTTPKEQVTSISNLIKRTKNIILARVISAELISSEGPDRIFHQVEYEFEKIEALKGGSESSFSIVGRPLLSSRAVNDFTKRESLDSYVSENPQRHNDQKFWKSAEGRVYRDAACRIRPSFAVGSAYLLFLDKPYHQKSFELVNSYGGHPFSNVTDKWYEHVKAKVK